MQIKSLFFILLFVATAPCLFAQNFKKQQQSQETAIEQAYRKNKISEREYYKLKEEQQSIKNTIEKANADDYMDAKEKNAIYSKLRRAEKRLRKYKTNREIY